MSSERDFLTQSSAAVPTTPPDTNQDEAAMEIVRELKRQDAMIFPPPPGKRCLEPEDYYEAHSLEYDEMEDAEPEPPDLAAYFAEFEIPFADQIKICRAYASYLAAQLPKRAKTK